MNQKTILVLVTILIIVGLAWWMMSKRQASTSPAATIEQTVEATPMDEVKVGEATIQPEENNNEAKKKSAVTIENFAFSPKTITIKKGDSITWTNNDSVGHTATGDKDEFDTGLLAKGESKTITFDKVGTFTYHCTPHPNMKATVVVE